MRFRRFWKPRRCRSEPRPDRRRRGTHAGEERLVRFGGALRADGVSVPTTAIEDFCRAVALLADGDVYWAGRATLVSDRADIATFDRVFLRFFGGVGERPSPPRTVPTDEVAGGAGERSAGTRMRPRAPLQASAADVLRHRSFADCTEAERAALMQLIARIGLLVPRRRSRRMRAAPRGDLDLGRTLRRSLRTGGDPVRHMQRRQRLHPRRLVMVLDVSGSMADYSRALLVFAHGAMRADPRWRTYCFATRVTPVTRALVARDPDAALAHAAQVVSDWDGGTRIGQSLRTILRHDREVVRGAVVLICSDGLEVGDAAVVGAQMARLSRLARRIVWLNPLKASPRYEPRAAGMAAALPFIDLFLSGHDLASLEELSERLQDL